MAAKEDKDEILQISQRPLNNNTNNNSPTIDAIDSLDLVALLPKPSELLIACASPTETYPLKAEIEPAFQPLPRKDQISNRGRRRRQGGKFDLAELMEEGDEHEKKENEEQNQEKLRITKQQESQQQKQLQKDQDTATLTVSATPTPSDREVFRFTHPIYQSGLSSTQSLVVQRDFHIYFRIKTSSQIAMQLKQPNVLRKRQSEPLLLERNYSQQTTNDYKTPNTLNRQASEIFYDPSSITTGQSLLKKINLHGQKPSKSPNDSSPSPTNESDEIIIKVPIQDETLELETVAEATRSAICYVNNMLVLQKAKIRLAENENLFELFIGKKDGRRKSLPALCPTEQMKKFTKSNLILVPISPDALIRQPEINTITGKQFNYGKNNNQNNSQNDNYFSSLLERQFSENGMNQVQNSDVQKEDNKSIRIEVDQENNGHKQIITEDVQIINESKEQSYGNDGRLIQSSNPISNQKQQGVESNKPTCMIINSEDKDSIVVSKFQNEGIQPAGMVAAQQHYNFSQDIPVDNNKNNIKMNKKSIQSTIIPGQSIIGNNEKRDHQQYDEQLATNRCCLFSCFFKSSRKIQ